ncbi:hypothetical protein, partial [Nonomuraea dietziae]|uniref:hypothetical protein n=1 Tax=Nonomuraea dietziae TaxID=65515 RepID=UPI0031E28641
SEEASARPRPTTTQDRKEKRQERKNEITEMPVNREKRIYSCSGGKVKKRGRKGTEAHPKR